MSTLIAERNEGTINVGDEWGLQYADVTLRMEPTAENYRHRDKVKAHLQVEAEYVKHGGGTGKVKIFMELSSNDLVYMIEGITRAQ